jgi:hypothetical protein
MKKIDRKVLEQKIYVAIEKVLTVNKAAFKNKTEDAIHKSIKKIAKKVDLKEVVSKTKHKKISKLLATQLDGFEMAK